MSILEETLAKFNLETELLKIRKQISVRDELIVAQDVLIYHLGHDSVIPSQVLNTIERCKSIILSEN